MNNNANNIYYKANLANVILYNRLLQLCKLLMCKLYYIVISLFQQIGNQNIQFRSGLIRRSKLLPGGTLHFLVDSFPLSHVVPYGIVTNVRLLQSVCYCIIANFLKCWCYCISVDKYGSAVWLAAPRAIKPRAQVSLTVYQQDNWANSCQNDLLWWVVSTLIVGMI